MLEKRAPRELQAEPRGRRLRASGMLLEWQTGVEFGAKRTARIFSNGNIYLAR